MGKIDKLLDRFKSKPKDFTYNELKKILNHFGYVLSQGSGSRVVFINKNTGHKIKLHKPHPGNILKRYQLDVIEAELKWKGLL
jgi:virulence-associated protein VapD